MLNLKLPTNLPLILLLAASGGSEAVQPTDTFCNPLDLEYLRQSADPSVVKFEGDYYMVASKSRGYWYSPDLKEWTLVPVDPSQLAVIDDYAPTIWEDRGRLYYTATGSGELYFSENPKDPNSWQRAEPDGPGGADKFVYREDDGSLYWYGGLGSISTKGEMTPNGDSYSMGGNRRIIEGQGAIHGWERRYLEVNGVFPLTPDTAPEERKAKELVEGAWMTRHNDIYYLQCASPGTQWTIYSDGVYTADSQDGPFTYAPNNPISHKPSGFIGGAGHGSTFRDPKDNYWRALTAVIGISAKYERRLVMFPAGFDEDDLMFTNTYLGDFPQYLPGTNPSQEPEQANLVGWMLLSYKKPAESSSNASPEDLSALFDENVKTTWSSGSNASGQWITVDLEKECTINAVQSNFYNYPEFERTGNRYYQYTVEVSDDGTTWQTAIDKSDNTKEGIHSYVALPEPVLGRYVKLTALNIPDGGEFRMSGLRIFGSGNGADPDEVTEFTVDRHEDERDVTISWTPVDDAVGYVIRWGIAPDKLYNSFQVMRDQNDFQVLNGSQVYLWYLTVGTDYYIAIDTFNENGITRGTQAVPTNPDDPVVPIADPSPIASRGEGTTVGS